MDFSNLTLLQKGVPSSSGHKGNTDSVTSSRGNRGVTVAVYDGTRGEVPKAEIDETEQYLEDLEARNKQQQLLLSTVDGTSGNVYNVRKRDNISVASQPELEQLVRGDIEGSYFGFSTRLKASPFLLPRISRPSSSSSSSSSQLYNLSNNDTAGIENSMKLSSSVDLSGSSSVNLSISQHFEERDKRPSTTGGRFVDTFRQSRSNTPTCAFAPSYTERNQLDYSCYYTSVPGSASSRGMLNK